MDVFRCRECGCEYSDFDDPVFCPECAAFREPCEGCSCEHHTLFGGTKLNLVAREDSECPVHGNRSKGD